MSERVNVADPTREPTDEELGRLMGEAFAELRTRRIAANAAMRRQIAERRETVHREWAERVRRARERP